MTKLTLCPVVKPFCVIEAVKPLDHNNQRLDHCRGSDDVIAVDVRVKRSRNAGDDASRRYTPTSLIRGCLAGEILDCYA